MKSVCSPTSLSLYYLKSLYMPAYTENKDQFLMSTLNWEANHLDIAENLWVL